jgi:hypothetical protein
MKKICVFIIIGIVVTLAAIAAEPFLSRKQLIEVRGDEYSYILKSNDLVKTLHRLGIDTMGKLVEADISILTRKLLPILAYVKNREVTEMNRYSTTRLDTEKASQLAKTLVLLAERHPPESEINAEVILKHFKVIEIK